MLYEMNNSYGQSLDRAYENEEYLNMWWEEQQIKFDRIKRLYEYEEWLEQEYTKGDFTEDDLPF
tara:strand:+ start:182 stop:373 length:192 start_codon:yes stop_codon:yes gene_type:complete